MNERTFSYDGASITVQWKDTEAWLAMTESDDPHALPSLANNVKAFLLEQGVSRVTTSIAADNERVYRLASAFGFVPWEVVMVLPLVNYQGPGKLANSG